MKAIVGVCLLLVSANIAFSQYDRGRIVGNVTDSSGAVLPGVEIKVVNDNTGDVRTTTSNGEGYYVVPNLLPADYTVSASIAKMSGVELKNVTVSVGQARTVDLVLKPAGVTETVTVSAGDLAQIDTASAAVGVNVSEREVAQLPLNGRQVSQLYLLAPGAVNQGSGSFDDIRFSGRSNQENVIRYDGIEGSAIVDANPGNLNGEQPSLFRLEQSLENIQEFRIDSNSYPAEYGTGTGGQISVITKSGTNGYHGSLFEYVRNNLFDARNYFNTKPSPQGPLRLNQFGGSIGGPIIKDKVFFFASTEVLKQRIAVPLVQSTLSDYARSIAVPAVRPLLGAFPLPTRASSSDPKRLLDIVDATFGSTVDEYSGNVRLDYRIDDRNTVYARYFRDQGYAYTPYDASGSALDTSIVPQNAVIAWNSVITPALINEAKFGYNGYKSRYNGVAPIVPGVDFSALALNISGSVALGGIAGQSVSAGIVTPTGLNRANSASNGRGQPYTNYSLSYIDNLSWVKGNHNTKFGFEIRPIRLHTDRLGGTTYTYNSPQDFLNNTLTSVQVLGDVSAPSPWNGGVTGNRLGKQIYSSVYAQDEWKIRPNLTLNYGLRYEYYTVLREDKNRDVIFNTVTGQIDPPDKAFYDSSKLNFGPRLALSFAPESLKNKTVFRVGAGYYYGPGQTEDQIQPIESDRASRTLSSGVAYPVDPQAILAGFDINSPTLGFQPRAYAPGYKIPEQVLSYTASVQQEILAGVLTVAYVGSQGRNLFLRSISNRIVNVGTNPTTGAAVITRQFGGRFAEVDYKTSGGRDNYNSMQLTYNRRFKQGLTLGSQYTWGRSIGDTTGSNEARTAAIWYDFEADRGSNNFDVRQSFNFSALYELPFGKGKRFDFSGNKTQDLLLGGWQIGGIVNARTGVPIEVNITRPDVVYRDNRTGLIYTNPVKNASGQIVSTAVINVPGGGASRNVRRPDVVPGIDPLLQTTRGYILNPAAFSVPAAGTFGNLARNALAGPALAQLDLTLSKRFFFTERANVEFRAEAYNILNHPNFANPPSRLNVGLPTGPTASGLQPGQAFTQSAAGSSWGLLSSTVGNYIGQGTNRQLQLALRLNF
jgi:hypothetical protein